jgi:hypothetical protein
VVADVVADVVPRRVPPDAAVVGAAERIVGQPGHVGPVHDDVVVRGLEGVARARAGVGADRAPRRRFALGIGERRALELELLQGAALARQVLRVALGFLGCRSRSAGGEGRVKSELGRKTRPERVSRSRSTPPSRASRPLRETEETSFWRAARTEFIQVFLVLAARDLGLAPAAGGCAPAPRVRDGGRARLGAELHVECG